MLSLKIPPHPKCVATLPCEIRSVLKATIENKTISVTKHFKKLTTGNNVFIVSVIVQSNCHILQFLHQMFIKCVHLAAGRRTQAGDATDLATGQWRRRLECVVQQQGRYIEHLM